MRSIFDLSALLARYGSFLDVFPTTIPVCRITASGALRCTPGSVANPLNRYEAGSSLPVLVMLWN